MKHSRNITIQVNGKTLKGRVTLEVDGIEDDDCVSPQMVLTAVAANQNLKFLSRHHKDRVAEIIVTQPLLVEKPALRLVA